MKNRFQISYERRELTDHDETKRRILEAGVKLWPYSTARAIGRELDLSHSAVLYHFGSSDLLQLDVARYAVHMENRKVILQLLAAGHAAMNDMKPADKKRYLQMME